MSFDFECSCIETLYVVSAAVICSHIHRCAYKHANENPNDRTASHEVKCFTVNQTLKIRTAATYSQRKI